MLDFDTFAHVAGLDPAARAARSLAGEAGAMSDRATRGPGLLDGLGYAFPGAANLQDRIAAQVLGKWSGIALAAARTGPDGQVDARIVITWSRALEALRAPYKGSGTPMALLGGPDPAAPFLVMFRDRSALVLINRTAARLHGPRLDDRVEILPWAFGLRQPRRRDWPGITTHSPEHVGYLSVLTAGLAVPSPEAGLLLRIEAQRGHPGTFTLIDGLPARLSDGARAVPVVAALHAALGQDCAILGRAFAAWSDGAPHSMTTPYGRVGHGPHTLHARYTLQEAARVTQEMQALAEHFAGNHPLMRNPQRSLKLTLHGLHTHHTITSPGVLTVAIDEKLPVPSGGGSNGLTKRVAVSISAAKLLEAPLILGVPHDALLRTRKPPIAIARVDGPWTPSRHRQLELHRRFGKITGSI